MQMSTLRQTTAGNRQAVTKVCRRISWRERKWWKESKRLWQSDKALMTIRIASFQKSPRKIFWTLVRRLRSVCSDNLRMLARNIWWNIGRLCKTFEILKTKFSFAESSSQRFLHESWLRWTQAIMPRYALHHSGIGHAYPNANKLPRPNHLKRTFTFFVMCFFHFCPKSESMIVDCSQLGWSNLGRSKKGGNCQQLPTMRWLLFNQLWYHISIFIQQ